MEHAIKAGPSAGDYTTHLGELKEVLGSWLQPYSALDSATNRGTNQRMEALSLILILIFQINITYKNISDRSENRNPMSLPFPS